ncbi:hypothetical protein [Nostoc sp. FACHB-110]|nr:hypothetical protein [Nostoc sp. FACHB-110]
MLSFTTLDSALARLWELNLLNLDLIDEMVKFFGDRTLKYQADNY